MSCKDFATQSGLGPIFILWSSYPNQVFSKICESGSKAQNDPFCQKIYGKSSLVRVLFLTVSIKKLESFAWEKRNNWKIKLTSKRN